MNPNQNTSYTPEQLQQLIIFPHSDNKMEQFAKISKMPYEKDGPRSQLLALFWKSLYEPFISRTDNKPSYLEINFKQMNGKFRTQYYELNDKNLLRAANLGLAKNEGDCVYYGVNPRKEVRKHDEDNYEMKATNSGIDLSSVLWLDVDIKSVEATTPKEAKEFILQLLDEKLPFSPSIIMDSGNGFHVYFLLDQPYDSKQVSSICARMEKHVSIADHCHDASRIMRMPGSVNRKDPKMLKRARFVRWENVRYSLDQFEDLPAIETIHPSLHMQKIELPTLYNLEPFPESELRERIKKDKRLLDKLNTESINEYLDTFASSSMRDKTRSGRDFHITCQLLKEGFTPEEITRIFISTPVGEKVREKLEKTGEATALSYMTKTLENALKALAEEEYNRRSKIQSVIIIDNPRY